MSIQSLKSFLPRTVWSLARGVIRGTQHGGNAFSEVFGISCAGRLKQDSIHSFGRFKVQTAGGTSFGLLRWHIMQRRQYDFSTETPALAVLDCGSNIGFSILRFREYYPEARITVAFTMDNGALAELIQTRKAL